MTVKEIDAADIAQPTCSRKLIDELTSEARATRRLSMPRGDLLRALMFSHVYHHRGQLTVYLRLLDVPLPPTYGPTADESPFAQVPA